MQNYGWAGPQQIPDNTTFPGIQQPATFGPAPPSGNQGSQLPAQTQPPVNQELEDYINANIDPEFQAEFRSLDPTEQQQYLSYQPPSEDFYTPGNEFQGTTLPEINYEKPTFGQTPDVSQSAFQDSPDYITMMDQMERQRRESTSAAAARGYRNDPRLSLELNRRAAQEAQLRYGNFYNRSMNKYGIENDVQAKQFGVDRTLYGDQYNYAVDDYNLRRGEYEDYYAKLASLAGVGSNTSSYLGQLGAGFANTSGNARTTGASDYGNALLYGGAVEGQNIRNIGNIVGSGVSNAITNWPNKPAGNPDWNPEFPP